MMYVIAFLGLQTLLLSQAAEPPARTISPSAFPIVGPGDTITIQAFQAEEISREWRVSESGDIDLPMLGRIRVAGLRTSQLESDLKTKLSEFIRNPNVAVKVSQPHRIPVTVTGAVEKPGPVLVQKSQTLFDAIVLAGGLKEPGKHLVITRSVERGRIPLPSSRESEDGRYWICKLDIAEVISGRTGSATVPLAEDDLIAVDEREPRLVHIIGEVVRPGSVELIEQDTVSLLKVVAVAGGLTRLASPKKVLIRKLSQEGMRGDAAVIDLEKITKGRAADLALSAGDVVIVESSNLKAYVQAATSAAVSSGIFTSLQTLARF